MNNLKFGKEARDKVTGFTGKITGKCEYMYGCNQYCLTPTIDEKGEMRDSKWFDEGRLEIIGDGITKESVMADKNGADLSALPNLSYDRK